MWKLFNILSKLKWLGLIGLVGDFISIPILRLFWFFWFFAFVDLFSPTRRVADSLRFFVQNLAMLLSLLLTPILHRFRLPGKDNYNSRNQYSLPFEGEWYVVNGGIEKGTSHSWFMYSQRYAYDFYVIDDKNNSYIGDREKLENYFCYQKSVIAPADGTVIAAVDLYVDTPIVEIGKADCAAPDVRGNYIMLCHENGEYSLIAHLLRDSIRVKRGDKVKRGQEIALCGNSGNTSEPHIHFQVQSGKSFTFSAGLPISFHNIEIDGVEHSKCFITNGSNVGNI